MKCKNRLCIYQKNNECSIKDVVELDWYGLCKNMIPIRISEESLFYEKTVAKLQIKDGKHYFENETGIIRFIDNDYLDKS